MEVIKLNESESQLPVRLEDLAQFVLIGRDKLTAVRAGIKALDKLDVAEGVRKQKREEAQMLAEALLDAEVRIGEILAAMPKSLGGRPNEKTIDSAVDSFSKMQAAKNLGFNQKQVERFQTLAANKDLVETIKQEAREADDLPTRTAVLEAAKQRKKEHDAIFLKAKIERENTNEDDSIVVRDFNVSKGDIWRLGNHLLICGDYFKSKKYDADAIVTDPPYGIDYHPDWKKWDGSENEFNLIYGDNYEFNPEPFLSYKTIVLFGANYYANKLPIGSWLCWDKRTKDELDNMIGSPFELAWFKSTETKKSAIMIRVLHGGVVNADSKLGNNQKRYHPTQKPIMLFEEVIQKLTNLNQVILDPFAGSGTTLLACENLKRKSISYEIDTKYCNIILSRYYQLTTIEPCLELNELK